MVNDTISCVRICRGKNWIDKVQLSIVYESIH